MSKPAIIELPAGALPAATSVAVPHSASSRYHAVAGTWEAAAAVHGIGSFLGLITRAEGSSYSAGVAGATMLHEGDVDIESDSSGVHFMESIDGLGKMERGSTSIGEVDGDGTEGVVVAGCSGPNGLNGGNITS